MEMLPKKSHSNRVVAAVMILGSVATVAVAAIATKGATGFRPDPHAWFVTLILPGLLLLAVTAYYADQKPY
jgi:hypothetical protein